MKWLASMATALLVAYGLYASLVHERKTLFQLTIELETPLGDTKGSSTIEVALRDEGWIPSPGRRFSGRITGDAVVLEIGPRGALVGLLATGRDGTLRLTPSFPFDAFAATIAASPADYVRVIEGIWAGTINVSGRVELQPPFIPTLVYFSDVSDPKSAKIVYAAADADTEKRAWAAPGTFGGAVVVDRIGELLGKGYRFKRAWIEVTRGQPNGLIYKQLPWLSQSRAVEASDAWLSGTKNKSLRSLELFTRRD